MLRACTRAALGLVPSGGARYEQGMPVCPHAPGWWLAIVCVMGGAACSGDGAGAEVTPEVADAEVQETAAEVDAPDGSAEVDQGDASDEVGEDAESDGEDEDVTVDGGGDAEVAAEVEVIVARCGDGTVDPVEACDDGDLDDLDGCDRACALGEVVRAPRPGEVVINELMIKPWVTSAPRGEWIELASLAPERVNLSGCALVDEGTDRIALAVEGGLTIESGGVVLAAGDPALAPAVVYTTMLLDDERDEVVLVCDGVEIDRVAWVPFGWPVIGGRALSLDPSRRDAQANDEVESWCAAVTDYGDGERGTPGAANPACAHLDRTVDRCRLLGEATVTGFADAGVGFEVEVEEAGLTDLSPGVDVSPELVVEVGSAAPGVAPDEVASFIWVRARPLEGYQAPLGSHADVWRGEVVAPVGTRRVMGRASRDGGASWRYCDRDGSDDGVSAEGLATLSVGPSPCAGVVCDSPPRASCADDRVRLLGFAAEGRCIPLSATEHRCEHAPVTSDCGALGRICEEDASGALCGAVPRTPVSGDLILSELMIRPTASFGQWVELSSQVDEPLLLTGCVLTTPTSGEPLTWAIEAPTVIGPRGFVVLGQSDRFDENGGAPVLRAWGEAFGGGLPTSGSLSLSCGEVLDEVTWDSSWPGIAGAVGAAASLSPLRTRPEDNDDEASWCRAGESYGAGDRGTPGAVNPNCPGDVVPVEHCQIGDAASLGPAAGTEATATVRVIARTWTARTLRTDPSDKLMVEVGHVARGAAPDGIASWSRGVPDTAWSASGGGVDPAEDRYLARFVAPGPGSWDLYARATADGGNTWVVCDRVGIVEPGGAAEPVVLNPVPSACWPDPCAQIPPPYCREVADGSPVEVIASSGPAACSLDGNAAACSFVETVAEDCADYGAECGEGADGAECVGFPRTPRPGEVVISELVIAAGGLELGEWIELHSIADDALDLGTCGLRSGGVGAPGTPEAKESWDFGAPPTPLSFVLTPGRAVTVARSGTASVNGNAMPVTLTSGIALDNAEDWLELVCGVAPEAPVEVIDRVAWDVGAGWVIPVGTSLQLSGAVMSAEGNDVFENFCAPGVTSPRLPNGVCPGDGVLDDCRVVAATTSVDADQTLDATVWVKDLGVTDARPVVDAAIGMRVEVGIGPEGEPPLTSFAWRWAEVEPDEAWLDSSPGPGGDAGAGWDRWIGGVVPDRVGTLRLLGRVSLDFGQRWRLCGVAGIVEGAAGERAITSRAGLCVPSPCTTPPAASCSSSTLTGHAPLGTCVEDDGRAVCSYASETFSCASFGGCNAAVSGCNATPGRPSLPGSVVVSEIMRDSTAPAPDLGEWIELHNPSATPFDLRGCELVDGEGARLTIARGVPDVILAGSHAVFARSAEASVNGGIPTSLGKPRSLGALALGNGSGAIALVCGGVEIDRVAWSFGWPGQTGVAMQLDRQHLNASDNDLRSWWCAASPSYGNAGNRGSPGTLNPSCP